MNPQQHHPFLKNRVFLGVFPTPLHRLYNLEKHFNHHYTIYIKRDDQTGLGLGGNKVRKLEYLLFEAQQQGAKKVLTVGTQQSNHCRQTAAACAKLGLPCHLVLNGQKPQLPEGNLLLDSLFGATLHFTGEESRSATIHKVREKLGFDVYFIPVGGSNLIGSLGYVSAVLELKEQLHSNSVQIDELFIASGSGGTQAGILLGKELFHTKMNIHAVKIDKQFRDLPIELHVKSILEEGRQFLKINRSSFERSSTKLLNPYKGAEYGKITDNELDVIRLLAESEGIVLDPIYTAKAFYAMLHQLKTKQIRKQSTVLFWHTGGFPTTLYYAEQFDHKLTHI